MRVPAAIGAAVLLISSVSSFAGASAAPAPTTRVVVRPVTATGHVRAGFTVSAEPSGQVDCSSPDPSPGALSRNIEFCSPSFEYAIACWKAAAPHRVLCMRNPRRQHVVRIPRAGAFASTNLAPASQRAPLVFNLRDGDHCSIRDGGTSPVRQGHPNWTVSYFCVHDGVVWMKPGAAHLGVNEAAASWTVVTGKATGPLTTRHIAKAWFVGTFRG